MWCVYHNMASLNTIDGSDYDGTVQTVTFTPGGPNIICVNIPIINGDMSEPTEDFTVRLDLPVDPNIVTEEPDTITVNIMDDDGKSLHIC